MTNKFIRLFERRRLTPSILCLVLLLVSGCMIRIILALKYGEMTVFYDELIHWKASQSFFYTGQFLTRSFYRGATDLLYSFVISFIHISRLPHTSYMWVLIFNSIIMTSTIIPVYIMATKFIEDKRICLVVCAVCLADPQMSMTATIFQENLYYPVFMWFLLYLWKLFDYETLHEIPFRKLGYMCLFILILSYIKQLGLFLILGLLAVWFYAFIVEKNHREKLIFRLFCALAPLCCFRFLLDKVIKLTYTGTSDQAYTGIMNNSIISIIRRLLNAGNWPHFLYAATIYIVSIILLVGFVPIVFNAACFKKMKRPDKRRFLFICVCIFTTMLYVVFAFYFYENFQDEKIRLHFRYFFYYTSPLLILFLSTIQNIRIDRQLLRNYILGCLIYFSFLYFVPLIPQRGSSVDCPSMNLVIFNLSDNSMLKYTVILLALSSVFILLISKKTLFSYLVLCVFLIVSIPNNLYQYKIFHTQKQSVAEIKNDAWYVNAFLSERFDRAEDTIIFFSDTMAETNCIMESYINYDYYFILTNDIVVHDDYSINFFDSQALLTTRTLKLSERAIPPDYIILSSSISNKFDFAGYDPVYMGQFSLYERTNETGNLSYYPIEITGVHHDKWVEESAYLQIQCSNPAVLQMQVSLIVDSPYFTELTVKYSDANTEENMFILQGGNFAPLEVVDIIISRPNAETNFSTTLTADRTFIPNQSDPRNLSFRLHDCFLSFVYDN